MAGAGVERLFALLQAHLSPDLQGKMIGAFVSVQAMAQAGLAHQAIAALDPLLGQLADELDVKLSAGAGEAAAGLEDQAAPVAAVEPVPAEQGAQSGDSGAAPPVNPA